MSFQLNARETFAENVARLARQRLDRVLAALPDGQSEAVHAARKDLKKLRALLRLARAGLDAETFTRENIALRDAGRAFSAVRDAQVLVGAFDALRPETVGHLAPETADAIHRQLADDVQATIADSDAHGQLRAAAETLVQVRARVPDWPLPRRDGWRVPGRGCKRVYCQGRRAMQRAATAPAEDDFHEWRKQVKYLAAQTRLVRPLRPGKLKKLARALDAMADLLGEEHDLSVLQTRLGHPPDAWMSPQELAVISGVIDARRRRLQAQALEIGRIVYKKKPGKVERRFERDWKAWRKG